MLLEVSWPVEDEGAVPPALASELVNAVRPDNRGRRGLVRPFSPTGRGTAGRPYERSTIF